jgi:transcription elongation factor GreA
MGMDDIFLTQAGYEKMMQELEYMKTTKRRDLARAIAEARAHGDLSENAEYDAARDAQGANEDKIMILESKLARARIIENENIPHDEILIGATAELIDLSNDQPKTYTLVAEEEADFYKGKISVTSPLGRGLLGHKVGETVEIIIPAGKLQFKVVNISR